MSYLVIENTPGYLPEDDDPPAFDDYSEAVTCLNERAKEYEEDPDGNFRVEYGWASRDNFAAVMIYDEDKTHDLGRSIEVVKEEDES